jgi:hypothetical protein
MQKHLHQENRVDCIKLPTNSCIKLELGQWNSFNNYLWVFNCCYDYSCHVRSSNNGSPYQPYQIHPNFKIIVHIELEECLKGQMMKQKRFEMSFENAIMELFV